jgi:hypothetical protein
VVRLREKPDLDSQMPHFVSVCVVKALETVS